MSELIDKILVEKYRPEIFDDLILDKKEQLMKLITNPKSSIPSFIFTSTSPGTGKTSTAKLICKILDCDTLRLNSSDERGIDSIREKIKSFASSRSSNDSKRCIFMDQADGLTPIAQDSLRNIMETYSDNCFFVLTCNKLGKIIEPIKSRCIVIDFDTPDKAEIFNRLEQICQTEQIKYQDDGLQKILQGYYPDIRSMIKLLHQCKVLGVEPTIIEEDFEQFLEILKTKDLQKLYQKAYDDTFDKDVFVNWFCRYLFDNAKPEIEKYGRIMEYLCDYEKSALLGVNREIVFISNMIQIMKLV